METANTFPHGSVLYYITMIHRSFARGAMHDVRTASELAHVRPAYAAGVRAAIATVTPLAFAQLIPVGATWMSIAGLNGTLIDRGGPYRMRAATMAALAVASALAVLLGTLLSGHLVLSVLVTFALALFCGLSRAWAEVGPGFGITTLVSYTIALAIPASSTADAFVRAAFIVVGGLWAMLLAIFLWPIRPYRPVRLRVAECYRALARHIEAAVERLTVADGSFDPSTLTSHVIAVRTAIEAARTALAVSRRGRPGETGRGERLLVLHEIADQIFAHVIVVLEDSAAVLSQPSSQSARAALTQTLAGIAATARSLATSIESETDVPRLTIDWSGVAIRPATAPTADIIDRIADYATSAAEVTASLNSGDPVPPDSDPGERIGVGDLPPEPVLFPLDPLIHPSAVVLHHALRVAIVTTAAVLITGLLQLNHGYWVTLTVVVILQPYAATTRQKALQRVAGTILGGMVAAALSALMHNPIGVLALVALFTFMCVALLPLNYGAFAVFGTPAFVLLAESSTGNWHLAGLRIVNTLIGGALALIGARILWPGDERSQLPELAAAALRANDEFLRRAIELVTAGATMDLGVLRDARRDIANAAFNAEDSFQRLMSEHRGPTADVEPIMTFLVYTRRIAASTAALAVAANGQPALSAEAVGPFERAAHAILMDLTNAIVHGVAPAPFPAIGAIAMPDPSTAPVIHQRLTRIARQLKLIHDAVARWMVPGKEASVVATARR